MKTKARVLVNLNWIKQKQFVTLIILLFYPISCFADTDRMLEGLVKIILFLVYSFTALSILIFYKFFISRLNSTKQLSLIISIFMTLVGLIFILTSGPLPDKFPDENDIEFTRKQLIIGYTILIPNLLIALVGPFIKSFKQFEAILGRSEDNNNILIWVRLYRISAGKFAITYFNSLDKERNGFRNFYRLVNLGGKDNSEKKQFASYQEAVDYIRNTHNLPEVKFVERGRLHSQYLKMLKEEDAR